MTTSNLKKKGLAACAAALRDAGFSSIKSSNAFMQQFMPGAFGWVGLNLRTSDLPRSLGVNPTIGVRHEALERVLIELSEDLPASPLPIVTRPLRYLMPEKSFRTWMFNAGEEPAPIASEIAEAVTRYGRSFVEKFVDWTVFSAEIESCGFVQEHMKLKIFPIVRALNGDIDSASRMVTAELARVGQSEDFYAKSYRYFASGFLRKFAVG
jgi:hypothetical protein